MPRTEKFLVFDSRDLENSRSDISLLDFSESASRDFGILEISTIENENISRWVTLFLDTVFLGI